MIEVCAACGSTPIYRDHRYVDDTGWQRIERIADRCSNPKCENADPAFIDFDWIVTKQA